MAAVRALAAAVAVGTTVGLAVLQTTRTSSSGPLRRYGINIFSEPDAGFVLRMESEYPVLHISDIQAGTARLPKILEIVERYAAAEGYSAIELEDAAAFEDMYLARQLRAIVGREPLSIYTKHGFAPVDEHAGMSRDIAALRESTIGEWRDELRKCDMFVPPEFAPPSARLSSFIEYDAVQRETVAPAEVKLLLRRMAINAIDCTCTSPLFSAARRIATGPAIKMRKELALRGASLRAVGVAVDQRDALKAKVELDTALQERLATRTELLALHALEEHVERMQSKQ